MQRIMRRTRLIATAAAGLAAAAAAAPAASAAQCAAASAAPEDRGIAASVATTLCLINDQRQDRGLRPLRLNSRLSIAARAHSQDMVSRRYFSHTSPGGVTFDRRLKRTGYIAGARSWAIGENLAWGSGTLAPPRAIVRAWMRSPGHRRNMLDRTFEEIGIGIVIGTPMGDDDGATYTTDFGARD